MSIPDQIQDWQKEYNQAEQDFAQAEKDRNTFELEWALTRMNQARNKIKLLEEKTG